MNRTSIACWLFAMAMGFSLPGSAAYAATKTWAGYAYVNNVWDTTTPNWNPGAVTISNADTANFGNHGQGTRQVITIGPGVAPAAITMAYWGGEAGSYEFTGGDISGAGTFTMTSDGLLHLPQSFSFSGGTFLKHVSSNLILEPTAAGTYHFGTGDITLDATWKVGSAQFNFMPTVAATSDNNFKVINGGGSIRGNANASWNSTVDLQATVGLTGSDIWSGMTFNLSNNNGGIEFFRSGSGSMQRFDGNVQGPGYDITFGDGITSGTPTDYEIVIDTASTWNVRNLILDSQATIVVLEGTDSQTAFDDVSGQIVVQGNTILATEQGGTNNYNSFNGTYYVENDYQLHSGPFTRIVADNIRVQDGGRVSGNGLLQAHTTGVTVNDGTLAPGLSIGTLNVLGNLNLTSDSLLDFELGAPGVGDTIAVTGSLVLDGTMTITMLEDVDYNVAHYYDLFTYSGSLTDNELTLVFAPYTTGVLDFSTPGVVGLNVTVVTPPTPEPSTLALLMIGVAVSSWRRRQGRGQKSAA